MQRHEVTEVSSFDLQVIKQTIVFQEKLVVLGFHTYDDLQ